MKGYPKKLKTKEDYYNCLAMVQAGELEAAGLVEALDALEERRYIPCNILQISNNLYAVALFIDNLLRFCGTEGHHYHYRNKNFSHFLL